MTRTARLIMLLLAFGSTRIGMAQVTGQVELYANVGVAETVEFVLIDAGGVKSAAPFTIPAGSVLVVTNALVTPNAVEGLYAGNLDSTGGNENRLRFRFDSTQQGMLHLPLAGGGLVFNTSPRAFGFATNPGAFVIRLLGHIVCTNPRLCVFSDVIQPPTSVAP